MAFLVKRECPGCRRFSSTGDIHHSREEWNKYHNGLKDNDYLTHEEMKDDIERGKLVWEKAREEMRKAKEENPEIPIEEWKVKKIMNRRFKKCR